jgi:N-acetylmuramoyl-L-alanine amidase-like protein
VTTYAFRQGIDYGPRDGTLALEFHMSEGGDDLPDFLARHAGEDLHQWAERVRGVSCNAALLSTGKIVQMLSWSHCSGNLNPGDRADEYGYYGGHHLRDVLGSHWPDPNMWSISMEIAGRRADGPTDAQVVSAIRWGKEMVDLFPSIRGTYGHHDQSPKGCPGLTPNMKAIFAGLGGHGLWTPQEADVTPAPLVDQTFAGKTFKAQEPAMVTAGDGHTWRDLDGTTVVDNNRPALVPRLSPYGTKVGGVNLRAIYTSLAAHPVVYIVPATVTAIPAVDCAAKIAEERELVKQAMIAAAEAL